MHEKEDSPNQIEQIEYQNGHNWATKFVVLKWKLLFFFDGCAHAVKGESEKDPEEKKEYEKSY